MLLVSTDFEVGVMDMFSDSYHVSYPESSDTEDQDGIESAFSGHAQSIFSSLDESIQKIDDFLAFQRRFVHGDVVCSIAAPSEQLGSVVDVDMIVDLETSFGELIEGVNSRKLVKLRSFSSGDYVIHGSWLGRVSRVFDCITVLLNNGSKCEVMVGDSADILPISPSLFDDGPHPLYYPGQHVSIKHHDVSETVTWLCGSLKAGRSEGIICHVEVGLVQVKWITSLLCIGCISSPPGHLQDPGMLTLLSCFSSANWQIGDCCMLPFDYHCCTKMSDKESVSQTVTPHLTKLQQLGTSDHHCKEIYSIAKSRIKVDVLWQDGQVSVGLDPEALLPVINIADHEFWPGQFVREKATCEDTHVSSGWNLGVVKSVDSKEKIVKVKWITAEPKQTVHGKGDTVEIVSAYELVEHPDASYLIGDIVILFPNCENFEGDTPDIHVNTQQIQSYRSIPAKKVLATSLPQVNDYVSHIGHVTGFKDESIEVRWASGLISKVHPYEIFGLDKLDEVASSPVVHRVVEDVPNEMAKEFKQAWHEKEVGNGSNRGIWDASVLLRPFAAFRFLTNVAERIFSISGSSSSPHCNLRYSNCLDEVAECSLSRHPSTSRQNLRVVNENIPLELNVLEINMPSLDSDELQFDGWEKVAKCGSEQIERSAYLVGFQKPELFKQFDSVNNYLDHHFANGTSMDVVASQVKRGWLKRVHKEWCILKNDLPDNIFVRVYEERVDLFRVSIVGQPGTPYHHGLFFFDIHLPGNYPQEPPHVHYHSGGLRLNPNLYESGKVCLSLLNTWTGSGTEVWNSESTILQVLLSLQALVLNDKPYFNEAGYDEQIGRAEAERNSINYNENAFLLTCKSMLNILRQPPKHFEILVEEHFADRAHDILLTCKAYMDGAQVGSIASGNGTKDGCGNSSAGFRIMLAKIFPMLVSSFTTKGIDCSQFICQATQEPPGFSKYLDTIERPRT